MRSELTLIPNSLSRAICEKKFPNMKGRLWTTQLTDDETNYSREIRVVFLTHKNSNEYFYVEYGILMVSQSYGINYNGIMVSRLVRWHKNTFQKDNMLAITIDIDYRNILIITLDFLLTTVNIK
jgi:hypothetical protein